MQKLVLLAAALGVLSIGSVASPASAEAPPERTTIVLVHGAFADSSSWNPVISELVRGGYPVIATANPLRSLASDAEYLSSIVASVEGPVVLVGHSYAGGVISMAAHGNANVTSLVYVAGFAPETGESAASLGTRFPTGTLGGTLAPPVALPDGQEDLYILQAEYWSQFAADMPEAAAIQMAATQRPITASALAEPAGTVVWNQLPSWFIWGSEDKNIPAALHAFMAHRADAKEAVEVAGASHVVMLSHPREVAAMIVRAAESR